ncbi:MAG: UDP-3-O-acyl-N-acetylglucosamine deacetylase [Planctomycetales bacterium]
MPHRPQRTIRRDARCSGVGFFHNRDATVRFRPAPAGHGVAFLRIDLPGAGPIPALIEHAVERHRRTALARDGVAVEMVEHVLAALAGLRIDNCLVELDAIEPPGLDGSALPYVEALLEAGIVEQDRPRALFVVEETVVVESVEEGGRIIVEPSEESELHLEYSLDYGADSPIPPQRFAIEVAPEIFAREVAPARTFVLETEVAALRAAGYGQRTTARDLLVFRADGTLIDNVLRSPDECARHKLLDCIGDFALLGCDVRGRFRAERSGHRLNRELVRRLRNPDLAAGRRPIRRAA